MQTVVVIVAHPDDEVLAFGGTMARHSDLGDRVATLILATGLAARAAGAAPEAAALDRLRDDARAANTVLGANEVHFGDFPDNRMDGVNLLDVVKTVESFLGDVNPSIVYTHHPRDLNVDHEAVARAVLTAARPLPGATLRRIYAGEVLSSSEYCAPSDRFVPNTYVDIGVSLERKCAALRRYRGEIRDWPHPRSVEAIEHLARLRGSECGHPAAEALFLIREVDPFAR